MLDSLKPRHRLTLPQAVALSVGLMGPTLAMSLNGIGVAGLVGPSVPLVFALGFVGVCLVAYGFVRLTRYFNHAGSVYALAGATIGPRAGFFAGFSLIGTYVLFAACILAAAGVFFNSFVAEAHWHWHVAWGVVALVMAAGVVLLSTRESRTMVRALIVMEGIGILAMLVLAIVIVVRTGFSHGPRGQHLSLTSFSPHGAHLSTLLTATVFAFLSWAGFEACVTLGEETDNPRRNIPGALIGALIVTGLLFVFIMFATSVGFGTDKDGIAAFQGSSSTLVDLGHQYVGESLALIIAFTALMSCFAAALGCTAAASRLVFALARDGFGPKALAKADERSGEPFNAVLAVVAVAVVMCVVFWIAGSDPFNVYYWLATVGILCLVVVYAVAAAGAAMFTLKGRGGIPRGEVVIPILAIAYLVYVYYKQSTGQVSPYSYFPYIAGGWCLLGLLVVVVVPGLATRIGTRLAAELRDDAPVGAAPVAEGVEPVLGNA
jgi:amino acid transporter